MPIVSGKLARRGKVLLCINHKLMCLFLIVLGKSAYNISSATSCSILKTNVDCRGKWRKYNCWNIRTVNSEQNSNDNESLWCVSILLSPSFNNNAQFNKERGVATGEISASVRLQQPPQGPCLHIKPQLCLRLEKKYLKHYARNTGCLKKWYIVEK